MWSLLENDGREIELVRPQMIDDAMPGGGFRPRRWIRSNGWVSPGCPCLSPLEEYTTFAFCYMTSRKTLHGHSAWGSKPFAEIAIKSTDSD